MPHMYTYFRCSSRLECLISTLHGYTQVDECSQFAKHVPGELKPTVAAHLNDSYIIVASSKLRLNLGWMSLNLSHCVDQTGLLSNFHMLALSRPHLLLGTIAAMAKVSTVARVHRFLLQGDYLKEASKLQNRSVLYHPSGWSFVYPVQYGLITKHANQFRHFADVQGPTQARHYSNIPDIIELVPPLSLSLYLFLSLSLSLSLSLLDFLGASSVDL